MNLIKICIFLCLFSAVGCKPLASLHYPQNPSTITNVLSAGQPYEKQLFGKDPDIWSIKEDLEDEALNKYLQSVMDKLWPFYKDEVYHYYVRVDQNPYVQSLIILPPSNRVYVSYSLLNVIDNEDELACLLAHEIGHIASYKYEEDQGQKRTQSGIFEKLLNMTGLDGGVKGWVVRQKNEINLSQISQEIEMKADLYGAKVAAQAGYDPFALVDLLNRLAQIKGDGLIYELSKLKGTHPTLNYRAKNLQDVLNKEGYKRRQQLNSELDSPIMARLWQNSFVLSGREAQKNEFYEDWQAIQNKKNKIKNSQHLSAQEFLVVMDDIKRLCLKYGIQREDLQLQNRGGRYFVGEKIYAPYPVGGRESFVQSLMQEINKTLEIAAQMAVGSIPVVGNAISLYELLEGKDFFTGDELCAGQRIISAMGVFVGSGHLWQGAARGIKQEVSQGLLKKSPQEINDIEKSVQRASKDLEEGVEQEFKYLKAENVNAELRQKSRNPQDYQDPYSMQGMVVEYRLAKDSEFVRVHRQDNEIGSWVTKKEDIKGLSPAEIKQKFALKDEPTHISNVLIPKNVRIRQGIAAKNDMGQGGGIQYEVLDKKELSWFSNSRPL